MKITAYGAAEEVTGSKHLIETGSVRLLLDCGMFQGHRTEADKKNRQSSLDPQKLNAIVLSHAHIDHSGLLPLFATRGFRGPIYATPATRDLCAIMLMESAQIQARDAEWLSKKDRSFVPPLYTPEDVQEVMRRFVSVPYEMRMPVASNVFMTFHDAGHVLGSAMVELEFSENGRSRRLLFSGDIGRRNMPILADPWEPRPADAVIMESTYGNRDHAPIEKADEKFAAIIRETCDRGGKIIIPSFALERTQEVVYALKRLENQNAIPKLPVFVDSPLAVNITEVFRLHTEAFDKDFQETMREGGDPFTLNNIRYIRDREQSIALNGLKGPAVIISASGMCEYGRILHHLRNNIEDPRNTVLIVGFQAEHTLGRRIVERQRQVKIFGVMRDFNAQVKIMNEFSAHAGRSELIEFGKRFAGTDCQVFLVHGETESMGALKAALETEGVHHQTALKEGVAVEA